jgi:hypothetical protein
MKLSCRARNIGGRAGLSIRVLAVCGIKEHVRDTPRTLRRIT